MQVISILVNPPESNVSDLQVDVPAWSGARSASERAPTENEISGASASE